MGCWGCHGGFQQRFVISSSLDELFVERDEIIYGAYQPCYHNETNVCNKPFF